MAKPTSRARGQPRGTASRTIGFRLKNSELRLLEQQAAALDIASPHELARQLVLDSLREAPQWSYLAGMIQRLREELATATEALLAKAGKISSQEAHKWVAETFQTDALDIEPDQGRRP